MFETNLSDGRFLPFEGAGAESKWKLELPGSFRQFDYDTISDVILHIRYTARQGGSLLGGKATEHLEELVGEANGTGRTLLFSLKHDFPSEWAKFKSVKKVGDAATAAELSFDIREEHFPYWSQGRLEAIKRLDLFAKKAKDSTEIETLEPNGNVEITTHEPDGGENKETLDNLTNIALPQPPDNFTLKFTLSFDDNSMEDLWLALAWGGN